jgi:hypothetical protein
MPATVCSLGFVDLKGSPWTAWTSSVVSKVQAKLSAGGVELLDAVGVDVTDAAVGDGDEELVTTDGCGLEQLATAAAIDATRIRRQRKR